MCLYQLQAFSLSIRNSFFTSMCELISPQRESVSWYMPFKGASIPKHPAYSRDVIANTVRQAALKILRLRQAQPTSFSSGEWHSFNVLLSSRSAWFQSCRWPFGEYQRLAFPKARGSVIQVSKHRHSIIPFPAGLVGVEGFDLLPRQYNMIVNPMHVDLLVVALFCQR